MSRRAWGGAVGGVGYPPELPDPDGAPDLLEFYDPGNHIGRVDHRVEHHALYCFPRNLRSDP